MSKKYENRDKDHSRVEEPDYGAYYTAKDYVKWTFDGLYELINGKVWKMAPAPGAKHQRASFELTAEFSKVFRRQKCEVFVAPFDVFLTKTGEDELATDTVVEPDLCIICDPSKITERGCMGAPDLVVEILSPSTAKKDLNDKYKLYEQYGIPEYWVVFPREQSIEIFTLQNKKYERWILASKGDVIQSQLFDHLRFNIDDIFPDHR